MVLIYFTAKDDIVQKAAGSIYPVLSAERRDQPVIVGGMAIQMHCQDMSDLLRPTADIDLMYLPNIDSYAHFEQGVGGLIAGRLKKQGYQVQLKKRKGANLYEVKIMNGQNGKAKELFFIHFDMPHAAAAHKIVPISERELDHAIEMPVGESVGLVKRIEDILPYKLQRTKKHLDNGDGSDLEAAMHKLALDGNWRELAKTPIEGWLQGIIDSQNSLKHGEKKLPGTYVISKDLYDMCLLARKIEGTPGSFNRAYYSQAKQEVEGLSKK